MNEQNSSSKREAGFSLIELIIAMAITIAITAVAGNLLAQSMNIRTRANEKVDALADAQRALTIMSREIAGAGFNLSDNGIVPADSLTEANGNSTIRIRSNLNKFNTAGNPWYPGGAVSSGAQSGIGPTSEDAGEDVKYFVYPAANTNLLARYDAYGGGSTVLANRLDSLHIHYFAQKVTYSTNSTDGCDISSPSAAELSDPSLAKYVVIAVCVVQSAVGAPGSPGYQPATKVLLVSDVSLRNSNLLIY
jgi:prepilin-type N-terminal cleavage/methylation domain-containing protein